MWTETEKAFWILENGEPDHAWIFERNGNIIYQRPINGPSGKIAPWISLDRVEVKNMTAKDFDNEYVNKYRYRTSI